MTIPRDDPETRSRVTERPTPSYPAPDVHGTQCVHVTRDNRRCEAVAQDGRPHGWLCQYHDGQAMRQASWKPDRAGLG